MTRCKISQLGTDRTSRRQLSRYPSEPGAPAAPLSSARTLELPLPPQLDPVGQLELLRLAPPLTEAPVVLVVVPRRAVLGRLRPICVVGCCRERTLFGDCVQRLVDKEDN